MSNSIKGKAPVDIMFNRFQQRYLFFHNRKSLRYMAISGIETEFRLKNVDTEWFEKFLFGRKAQGYSEHMVDFRNVNVHEYILVSRMYATCGYEYNKKTGRARKDRDLRMGKDKPRLRRSTCT